METEQRFATFFPNASKGRKIGAVLSWLAAVLLMIALFIPGFCLKYHGTDEINNSSKTVQELIDDDLSVDRIKMEMRAENVPESILPIADIVNLIKGEKISVFSYLMRYDASFTSAHELAVLMEESPTSEPDLLASKLHTSNFLGIVLFVLLVLFIVSSVIFAFYTMNILSFLMSSLSIAEIILIYLLRFKLLAAKHPVILFVNELSNELSNIIPENGNSVPETLSISPSIYVVLMLFLILAAIVQIAGVIVHYTVRGEWEDDINDDYPNDINRTAETGLIERDSINADANLFATLIQLNTSREFKIYNNTEVILGKGSQANIIISNPVISRVHAKITCRNYTCTLEDLNSKNGTFLNDKKLPPKMPSRLNSGDYITLGNEMFGYKE